MKVNNEFDFEDPRLSAYALGELDESERAKVEALLASNSAAREFVDELRKTAATLEGAFKAEAKPELTAQQRERIVAGAERGDRAKHAAPKRTKVPLRAWASYAAAAGVAVALGGGIFAFVWRSTVGPQTESEGAALRIAHAPRQNPRDDVNARLEGLGYIGGAPRTASTPAAAHSTNALAQPLRFARYEKAKVARVRDGVRLEDDLKELGYIGLDEIQLRQAGADTENYATIVENPFISTAIEPTSTFSIDVDTASYANVRRFLMNGERPPPDAVRIEELINYFEYDYPAPRGATPFAVNAEVARCPWNAQHLLARIALKGREVAAHERNASNLVFLIDVSGSMNKADKLPLVVASLKMLVQQLDARDRIALVVYAGSSGLVLDSTSARDRATVVEALERLSAGGSTNGGDGIQLAYKLAREHFVKGGTNRVLLCTDGDFNVGVTSHDALIELIESERRSGVFLSVLGFGTGNLKDATMEQLADKGNGNYAYIDSLNEARKVLVEQIGGTLETIAKDVKIQVAINPAKAQAYRLIGYENRVMANEDFADDTKDAGEIGAGHCVTALYEIVPVGVPFEPSPADRAFATELRALPSFESAAQEQVAFGSELALVKLRFKAPDGDESKLISAPLNADASDFARASIDFRFAASVAAFGMKLRNSRHVGRLLYNDIYDMANASLGRDEHRYRVEFLDLVRRAMNTR